MATSEITPFEAQKKFIDPRDKSKRYYGYVSGVGAGKTFAGILRTIHNMQDWNPGEMGAIIAPTRQMIINVIIPEMRGMGLFEEPHAWEYKSAYSDQPGIYTPEGSRALMLSADNTKTVERLRGLNLAWVWMDERTAIPNRAQEIAMQRLRVGEYRNLYVTTTPKGKDDTYDFFVGSVDVTETELKHGTLYEAEDRRAVVGVPTDANPHTPDDYKDAMEADLPEQIRAQEVEGKFVEVGSGVYQREHFDIIPPGEVNSDDSSDWWQTIITVDPAVQADSAKAEAQDSDYWAVTVADVHTRLGEIYITDTAKRRGMTLQEGVEWLSAIYKEVENADMIVEANQSQRYLVNALNQAGISVTGKVSTSNKEARLTDLSIPISRGQVKFVDWNHDDPEGHPYQDLVQEALSFPEGSHDDQLDSLYLAVKHSPVSTSSGVSTIDGWADE